MYRDTSSVDCAPPEVKIKQYEPTESWARTYTCQMISTLIQLTVN